MATTSHDVHTEPKAGASASFVWARLGSFLSILPLGVWTTLHLWNNLAAFRGAQEWQRAVTEYAHPISFGFTTGVIVLLPLALHTVWGLQRLFSFRPNNDRYGNFDNLKYILQRMAAVGLLAFLGAHLWLAFLHPRLGEGHPEAFQEIASEMHWHGPTLIVYLLGTLAVAFHLANGLFGFAWTWGLTAGRRAFKRVGVLSIIVFLVLLGLSWGAIFALYEAGAQFQPLEH